MGAACNRNPAVRKQQFLERGDSYFNDKHYSEAVIEYKKALRADPTFGEAYYRLGLALLRQGQWPGAGESLSRAVQFSPDNLDARLRMGDILVAAGQYDDARTQAGEVLKRDPQNASVHLLLGQIQLQQKKYNEAAQEFEQARQRAPQDPVPYGSLGLAQLLNGNFDGAEKNFQKAAELSPKDPQYAVNWANFYRSRQRPARAEQVLRQSMTENPNAIELPLAVADLYVYQGRAADAKRLLDQTEGKSSYYSDAQHKVADFYFQHNDASSALDRYLALAPKHSSDESLVESIVRCYLQLGRWPDAERWIDKQDKKDKDPAFQLLRARAYIGEHRLRDAVSELQGLIQEEPANTLAHFYLAQTDLQRGELEAAKAALADALRVQPGYVSALLGLGDIGLQQNDSHIALEYADQIIAQSYWVVDAHLLAGNAYVLRNNPTAALKEFQIAAALDPNSPAAQERIGRVLSAEGKFGDAEKAYENALNADPGYALALGGLAENFVAQGQADRARARIDQQVERQPGVYQLQLIKGEFCLNHSDWECSEQSFKKALEFNSYDPTAYMALARVYAATNRIDQVVQQYETARQKFPEFLPTYIQLGRVHEERDDFDRAKQAYQDALQIDQNYTPALNNLAWLYCEHDGSLNEALELAQQAKKQRPDDPHINDTLAWIYYKKGLYQSAVGLLESAVAKSAKDPGYQFHLGMVYLALGKQEQGRRTLQAALRVGLNSEEAKTAREALQKAGS
jgi:tetratricopeptide (TPR) repeat protein